MREVAVQNGQAVAKQDKAARLEELAERINGKNRARDAAVKSALGQLGAALWHALDAGDLLLEAKELCEHNTFEDWIRANCEVSVRRAQEYMFLARGRKELEEVKARASAFSTIEGALEFLRMAKKVAQGLKLEDKPMQGPPIPGFRSELPIETKARRAREREEQKLLQRAEFALRTGNLELPPDLDSGSKWQQALLSAQAARDKDMPDLLDISAHQLHILSGRTDPEAVGRYLAEQHIGYEEAEKRAAVLAELQAGRTWLERVLQEADAHLQQRDRYEEAPKLGEG